MAKCKAQGKTDQQSFKVGDNGIGIKGRIDLNPAAVKQIGLTRKFSPSLFLAILALAGTGCASMSPGEFRSSQSTSNSPNSAAEVRALTAQVTALKRLNTELEKRLTECESNRR